MAAVNPLPSGSRILPSKRARIIHLDRSRVYIDGECLVYAKADGALARRCDASELFRPQFDSNPIAKVSVYPHRQRTVSKRDLVRVERLASPATVALGLIIEGAALFHDVGKATLIFREKLDEGGAVADPIRHEVISALVMKQIAIRYENDDGWIAALSDPDTAASAVRMAWEALQAKEKDGSLLKSLTGFNHVEKKLDGTIGRFHLPNEKSHPVMRALVALVLIHHRLPTARVEGSSLLLQTGNLIQRDITAGLENLKGKGIFDIPKDKTPLWGEIEWTTSIAEWAKRVSTSDIRQIDPDLLFKTTAIIGRASLQLGDHKASALGKEMCAKRNGKPAEDRLFANTIAKNKPGEYLADHMRSVRKRARMAGPDIGKHKTAMPHVKGDDIPESITSPAVPKESRFRWQVDAAKATSSHIAKHASQAGFFGILMAGTGSGKTRAIPSVMAAASGSLRYTLALGLRNLTLQSGDAYLKECKFEPRHVAVVIGSEMTQRLHELRQETQNSASDDNGTSAEDAVPEIVVPFERDAVPKLPRAVEYFLANRNAKDKIGIPILVTTIDSLMPAAHAKRGSHLEAMLRLATSDLVIDEIDDYGNEDLVAIGRLVFLAGTFGRRVLLSSATTGYVIAKTFFDSYREGYALHAALHGVTNDIDCGWYSDVEGSSKCVRIDCVDTQSAQRSFDSDHAQFVARLLNDLSERKVYRRGQIIKVGDVSSADDYFRAVSSGMRELHKNTSFRDEATGKRLSIGVVRWNNVSPSIEYVRWLSKQPDDDLLIRIIPYNGRMLPAARFEVEKCLDELLSRKPRNADAADPVLENPRIRELLDGNGHRDVCVVVVTTSLEEVGRDHDYDWVLTEPMSERSVIQLAGRSQRHRMNECVLPNVGLLKKSFKHALPSRADDSLRPFSSPGVESRVDGDHERSESRKFVLQNHEATFAYNMDRISERIDASDAIRMEEAASPLARLERARLTSYLVDGVGRPLSPSHYTTQIALITSYHADNRKFRRQDGDSFVFYMRFAEDRHHWRRKNVRAQEDDNVDGDFYDLDINEKALFISPVDIQTVAEDISRRISGDEQAHMENLLSIEMQIRDVGRARFLFHPWVGMSDFK